VKLLHRHVRCGRPGGEDEDIPEDEANRLRELVEMYNLPSRIPDGLNVSEMMNAMEVDKKAKAGKLRFILPESIGMVRIEEDVDRGSSEKCCSLRPELPPLPKHINRRIDSQLKYLGGNDPAIIGAAMRFMTSEPAPVLNMIGISPARITLTVMSFGLILLTAPCMMASLRSSRLFIFPSFFHCS